MMNVTKKKSLIAIFLFSATNLFGVESLAAWEFCGVVIDRLGNVISGCIDAKHAKEVAALGTKIVELTTTNKYLVEEKAVLQGFLAAANVAKDSSAATCTALSQANATLVSEVASTKKYLYIAGGAAVVVVVAGGVAIYYYYQYKKEQEKVRTSDIKGDFYECIHKNGKGATDDDGMPTACRSLKQAFIEAVGIEKYESTVKEHIRLRNVL